MTRSYKTLHLSASKCPKKSLQYSRPFDNVTTIVTSAFSSPDFSKMDETSDLASNVSGVFYLDNCFITKVLAKLEKFSQYRAGKTYSQAKYWRTLKVSYVTRQDTISSFLSVAVDFIFNLSRWHVLIRKCKSNNIKLINSNNNINRLIITADILRTRILYTEEIKDGSLSRPVIVPHIEYCRPSFLERFFIRTQVLSLINGRLF